MTSCICYTVVPRLLLEPPLRSRFHFLLRRLRCQRQPQQWSEGLGSAPVCQQDLLDLQSYEISTRPTGETPPSPSTELQTQEAPTSDQAQAQLHPMSQRREARRSPPGSVFTATGSPQKAASDENSLAAAFNFGQWGATQQRLTLKLTSVPSFISHRERTLCTQSVFCCVHLCKL